MLQFFQVEQFWPFRRPLAPTNYDNRIEGNTHQRLAGNQRLALLAVQ
jgi:hypothetical protein